jgi:hypothetical protein
MMWMDYNIMQAGNNFKIEGDWPGEVMGFLDRQGKPGNKDHPLYQPGDVFIVNNSGWLVKTDQVNALLLKHESTQKTQSQQLDQTP